MECGVDTACSERSREGQNRKAGRETLLLLHGSAGSSALWKDMQNALSPLYLVVAPDLIGYGDSTTPWPERAPFALEDEVRQVDNALPCCESGLHAVGYSYGGAVALALAQANPVRVRTLALIEPVFFPALRYAGEHAAYEELVEVRARFVAALDRGEREVAMRGFIEFWTGKGSWEALPQAMREGMLAMSRKIRLDWDACFAADPGMHSLAVLARKTILIRGDRSPEPMRKLVDALHELMPESTKVVIRGANHLLPLTHRSQLTDALISHLRTDAERVLR